MFIIGMIMGYFMAYILVLYLALLVLALILNLLPYFLGVTVLYGVLYLCFFLAVDKHIQKSKIIRVAVLLGLIILTQYSITIPADTSQKVERIEYGFLKDYRTKNKIAFKRSRSINRKDSSNHSRKNTYYPSRHGHKRTPPAIAW